VIAGITLGDPDSRRLGLLLLVAFSVLAVKMNRGGVQMDAPGANVEASGSPKGYIVMNT
jgi:hypothetical protein